MQERPGLDRHTPPDHRVLPQGGAALDPAVGTDEGGALDIGIRIHLGSFAQPDTVAELETGELDVHLPVQDVAVGRQVRPDVTHVRPVAVGDVSVDGTALLQEQREQVLGEVEFLAVGDRVDDVSFQHVDAGIDGVAEHVAPPGLLEESLHPTRLVGDDDAELQWVGNAGHGYRDGRPGRFVELDHLGEIHVGQGVPRKHERPVVQERGGVPDAPGCPQRLLLGGVGERHAEVRFEHR